MKYSQLREFIKTGDVLAFSGTAIYSKIIQCWTSSPISHVGLALWLKFPYDEQPNRLCVLEAHWGKGVQIHLLKGVLEKEYWSREGKAFLYPTELDGDEVASNALKYWSEAYANPLQFIIAGSTVLQALKGHKNLDTDKAKQHCSELVCRAMVEAGGLYDKNPAVASPADVVQMDCLGNPTVIEEG